MGYMMILWIILVTVVTVYYLNIPPPDLSPRLKTWYKKGNFMKYKEFDIFYIDEDGILTDDSTLLLIHGFPTSSHDWIKILDDMKEQYSRIIIPDMLGFGFTDKPKQYDYLITEQADILEAVLKSLSVKDVHIMSHDYGDTVALELLHRHNTGSGYMQVNSLCMLNGGLFQETYYPRLIQKALLVPVLGDLLSHLSFYGSLKRGLGSTFGPKTQPSETDMRDFYTVLRYKEGNVVMSRLIHYITQRNENKERWVGALQKTKVPVHMIYGPADPVNPPVFVDHYKKVVPNPHIEVLPIDIGHYPQWEYPNGVVSSYLQFLETIKDD
ncbi:mesoderm-specific transcript protein-like isoform X2 [Ruditapes philippinarum]|uniref:mesoderm-specific transcript protein-like isoform X2 n=1 Tax=Ruditapes philippinarum TaxID=129788 RepID=UPI00295C1298|nr:mesoderm-specific transcript protein-like isoform X2 [Ruditapes philippinarum]